jgi:hypothetical protein
LGRHANTKFDPNNLATLEWDAQWPEKDKTEEALEIYIEGAKPTDIADIQATPGVTVMQPFNHGISNALVIRAIVPKGHGSLTIEAKSKLAAVDAYFNGAKGPKDKGACSHFQKDEAENGRQVCTPGTALSALSVSSYDFNDVVESRIGTQTLPGADGQKMTVGQLSADCNAGSLRSNKVDPKSVRPDFAAPGQYFVAPVPKMEIDNLLAEEDQLIKSGKWDKKLHSLRIHFTEHYIAFNGTSAATPYAAGICALLLERKKDLTVDELRAKIKVHGTSDSQTGKLPNPRWGRGKLDVKAVGELADAVKE